MIRLFCLSLVVALASSVPSQAQKKEPPKNFTNSIGMKFVWIPPGSFVMGSPKDEKGRQTDETQHKITLSKGFYMGVYAVTQGEWGAVMGNNPSHFKGEKNLPVDKVSWDDCQEFITKLRAKDKKLYRSPTEAEWEYSCRAGTKTPFYFGQTISTDQANYNGDYTYGEGKKGKFRVKTTPVGSFPANAWGLHDMHGNVWQWCQDWYGGCPAKEVVNPQGSAQGTYRVMRGGSWKSNPDICSSAFRGKDTPDFCGYHFADYGFRVVAPAVRTP
jgi:formylglycine-generating enzyme required for sulfatase activity